MAASAHPRVAAGGEAGPAVRARLSGFVRTLRDNGFRVGLAESRDALAVLSAGRIGRIGEAKAALKALLCGRRSDWDAFDDLFDAFWTGRGVKSRARLAGPAPAARPTLKSLSESGWSPGGAGAPSDLTPGDGSEGDGEPNGRREGASRHAALSRTDFRRLADPDEIAAAHALAARLAAAMRARLTRRHRAARSGRRIDLRRTIRASLPHGGTPLDLVRRARRERPLKLVVLLDASGSMSLYTAVFVRFVHGVLDHFREAEAFLFHTRLVHVSAALKEKDAGRALDRLGLMAEGVGGGTRIGDSLAAFNRGHAAKVIHARTCVMILSDGYDTGEPERLGAEMAALARRCRRIVWLNPLIGSDGYAPDARGMAAALPHVAVFAPASTLESLAALEPILAGL